MEECDERDEERENEEWKLMREWKRVCDESWLEKMWREKESWKKSWESCWENGWEKMEERVGWEKLRD